MHKSQTHHASCVYNRYVCLRVCVWVILNRKKCLHFIFGKVQRSNPVKKWYVTPTCCGLRSRSYGRPLSHILFCALLFLWSAHKTINISGDFRLWGRSWSCGRFINNDCQRRLLIVCVCGCSCVCACGCVLCSCGKSRQLACMRDNLTSSHSSLTQNLLWLFLLLLLPQFDMLLLCVGSSMWE